MNVFELSSIDESLSSENINKNYYEKQIYLLLYDNHPRLRTNLHTFCKNNENQKHFCRRCLNTYVYQSKLEEHMLG